MKIYQTKKAKNNIPQDDLRRYRIGPFTLLQLMSLLAITGLTATAILLHFFG